MKPSRWHWLSAAGICALLAVVHTWPLASAPGTLSRNDNADTQLNEWILAWVVHQLPKAPLQLFDGNIFYPSTNTLAFSEPLIVPALLGAPFLWLGASPVLNHNLVLLLGFALTALAMYVLVHHWTGDRLGALLAGSIFAFNTHTLTRLAHVQAVHAWGLPLVVLSADRVIVSARFRDAITLAVWMAAMAWTSGYLAIFAIVLLAVVVVVRAGDWMGRAPLVLSRLAIGAGLGAVLTLPVYVPYRRAAIEQGMRRSLENVGDFSVSPWGYLATAGRLHFDAWSSSLYEYAGYPFFPGVVVIVLAAAALLASVRSPGTADATGLVRARVLMLFAILLTGFLLSLGTRTPVYGWLYHSFPPVRGIRAAYRFGNLFLLGIAALAGIGLATGRRRYSFLRRTAVAAAIVAAVNLESLRAPLYYTPFEGIPSIYRHLAAEPRRVVLVELPFYRSRAVFHNGLYVLNSTAHWRPIVNGYSGYIPRGFGEYAEAFDGFPSDSSIRAMREAGATHVALHAYRLDPGTARQMMDAAAANPTLVHIAVEDGIILYRFR